VPFGVSASHFTSVIPRWIFDTLTWSGEISPANLAVSLCKFSAVLAQPVDDKHTMTTGKTDRFILYPEKNASWSERNSSDFLCSALLGFCSTLSSPKKD
jgi:hypothetical protein